MSNFEICLAFSEICRKLKRLYIYENEEILDEIYFDVAHFLFFKRVSRKIIVWITQLLFLQKSRVLKIT